MRTRTATLAASLLLSLMLAAREHARIARVTRIDIENVESPTFGGTAFGNSGAYEKLTGKAYGELDPGHELNRNVARGIQCRHSDFETGQYEPRQSHADVRHGDSRQLARD